MAANKARKKAKKVTSTATKASAAKKKTTAAKPAKKVTKKVTKKVAKKAGLSIPKPFQTLVLAHKKATACSGFFMSTPLSYDTIEIEYTH